MVYDHNEANKKKGLHGATPELRLLNTRTHRKKLVPSSDPPRPYRAKVALAERT